MRPEPLGRVLEVAAPCGCREALLHLWVCSTVGSSTALHPHGVTGLRFITGCVLRPPRSSYLLPWKETRRSLCVGFVGNKNHQL